MDSISKKENTSIIFIFWLHSYHNSISYKHMFNYLSKNDVSFFVLIFFQKTKIQRRKKIYLTVNKLDNISKKEKKINNFQVLIKELS